MQDDLRSAYERIRQIERKALITLTKRFVQRGINSSLFLKQ